MDKLKRSIEDYPNIFRSIKIQPGDVDYEKAKKEYIPFLKLIDSLQTSIVVSFDFYKNDDEKWIRLLIQNEILELDKQGNLWIDLKLCDFSPNQDLNAPGQFIFRSKSTGEVIYSLQGENFFTGNISNREKEILGLISEGHKSSQIAEKLFISVNTVNNHRRNMIEKLNVSNSSEAVKMAAKLGMI